MAKKKKKVKLKDKKDPLLEVFDLYEDERKKEGSKQKKYSKLVVTFIFEAMYIFILEMLFKIIFGSMNFDWSLFRILTSSCFLSMIITLIVNNLKSKPRMIILLIFNFILSFYAWLQMGFQDFLGAFMSIGNAEQGTKITDYIVDFVLSINWKTYFLLAPFVATFIFLGIEDKFCEIDKYNLKNKKYYKPIITVLGISSLLFYLSISVGFMQNKYQAISNVNLFKFPSNPTITIKNYGTSVYLLLDINGTIRGGEEEVIYKTDSKRSVEKNNEKPDKARKIDDTLWNKVIESEEDASYKTLHDFFVNRKIVDKNNYTGKFKGKNLIVLMLESVGYAVFDPEYKDYFPTLYKLNSEGISAINNYSPRNNCATGESEMTSQLSLYSISTTCTVNTYKKNVYPQALMNYFKNDGYFTTSFHDYTNQYYYRNIFEPNFGSMRYFSVTDLGMTYNPIYKEWPSDVTFVENALPKILSSEHYASFLVTVTSHSPYMYSSEWGDAYLSLFDDLDVDKTTKRYLSKVKVVDLALEYLINNLKENGKLDDTVIVLFGDHYPYALSNKQYASIAKYDISENQDVDRTPFIIYNSATKGETIKKYISPLDYTPTLLNLFGYDYDPRYYVGNDIFSDYTDFVLFPDNSWQSSKGFYNASRGEFMPLDENAVIDDEDIIKLNSEVTNLRNMSALAIKKNYFNHLYEALEKEKENLLKEKEETVN